MLSTLKLTSKTPLGKEEFKKVKTILQSLYDNHESFDFRMPVDWKTMGLLDYAFLIKNPMDLGTIDTKLKDDRYETVEEVLDDIQLVWDNCKTYNSQNTWIHGVAQKLERSFKKMVKNYLPNIPIIVPGRNVPDNKGDRKVPQANLFEEDDKEEVSYHEKMKFYEKLKNLSAHQVGRIVEEVINRCPSAFKEVDEENVQIVLDNMDSSSFQQVNSILDEIFEESVDRVVKKQKVQ